MSDVTTATTTTLVTPTFHAPLVPYSVNLDTAVARSLVPTGCDTIVINWKTPQAEKGNASYKKPPAVIVPLPTIAFAVEPAELITLVTSALNQQRENIIRDCLIVYMRDYPGTPLVNCPLEPALFSIAGILAYQASKGEKQGKLSKVIIGDWFKEHVQNSLFAKFQAVPNATPAAIINGVGNYKAALEKLAAPSPGLSVAKAKELLNVVGLCKEANPLKARLLAKLDTIINPPSEIELATALDWTSADSDDSDDEGAEC